MSESRRPHRVLPFRAGAGAPADDHERGLWRGWCAAELAIQAALAAARQDHQLSAAEAELLAILLAAFDDAAIAAFHRARGAEAVRRIRGG
jgi:hypothetical protein